MINCEVNLILRWSSSCVITNSTGLGRFAITDTKRYVPVVTLSTQINAKLLQQLFVLPFENENGTASHSEHYLPKVEIKDYNVKIDGKNVFDQPINDAIKTYENIFKNTTG